MRPRGVARHCRWDGVCTGRSRALVSVEAVEAEGQRASATRRIVMSNKFITHGLVAALLLVGVAPAMTRAQEATQGAGQEQAAPAQKAERPNLNLTDDQKAQMKKIREDAKSQIDAVKSDGSLSADQ